jgi:hypothetical protein
MEKILLVEGVRLPQKEGGRPLSSTPPSPLGSVPSAGEISPSFLGESGFSVSILALSGLSFLFGGGITGVILYFLLILRKQPEAKASKLVSAIKPTKDIRTTAKAMLLSIFCRSAHVVFG